MLDLKWLVENRTAVEQMLADRGSALDLSRGDPGPSTPSGGRFSRRSSSSATARRSAARRSHGGDAPARTPPT
jgi:hypothetical protein